MISQIALYKGIQKAFVVFKDHARSPCVVSTYTSSDGKMFLVPSDHDLLELLAEELCIDPWNDMISLEHINKNQTILDSQDGLILVS